MSRQGTVTISIEVPEPLAEQIEQVRARLPEVLELGLLELSPLPNQVYRYILEFLVSEPTPDALLKFAPTPDMQARVKALLEKDSAEGLAPAESKELDEYVRIDQLVTLLKARALPYLRPLS